MVLKLSVVNAEAVINRQPESERHHIRQLILSSSKESDLRNHYKKQAEDAAIMNISVAAKKKLETFKTTIISISSGKVAAAVNDEKSLACRKQAQLMDLASEIERQLCRQRIGLRKSLSTRESRSQPNLMKSMLSSSS
jgi:hypothetical protein